MFSHGRYGNYYYGHICVFASKYAKVNSPTTLKGRSQLDEQTVVCDRRNASKRIHVKDHWMCQNLQNYEHNRKERGNEHVWQDHVCDSC